MSDSNTTQVVTGVKFSLRYKLIIGFFLVFSIPFAAAYYWFWQYSVNTAMNRIHDDLLNTLRGTIQGINGDKFEALVKDNAIDGSGIPLNPYYWDQQNWLVEVYWVQPKAYNTYTYVHGEGPDDVLWIGDNYRYTRPDISTKYKEPYTRTPDSLILEGFERETVNMTIYDDPWGQHVSAYGPIRNSKNEVVGAVGIDFQATEVINVQRQINTTMAISGVVAFLALFLVIYAVANYLTNPMIKLATYAQRVGEGDYNQDFSSLTKDRFPDEIDVLASNFAGMVDKVYTREQTLRRQVEELKIEIDEAKRSRQVEEIVETDFFRELQAKANRMRTRRMGDGQPESPETPSEAPSETPASET